MAYAEYAFAIRSQSSLHVVNAMNCCQRFANEIPEPNANKRDQSSSDSSEFTGFSRSRASLITVWLEVRVLRGPPRSTSKSPVTETLREKPALKPALEGRS